MTKRIPDAEEKPCLNCGRPVFVHGFKKPLCSSTCRNLWLQANPRPERKPLKGTSTKNEAALIIIGRLFYAPTK